MVISLLVIYDNNADSLQSSLKMQLKQVLHIEFVLILYGILKARYCIKLYR